MINVIGCKDVKDINILSPPRPQRRYNANSKFQRMTVFDRNTQKVACAANKYPTLSTLLVFDYTVKACR